jgi:hypothetical protein
MGNVQITPDGYVCQRSHVGHILQLASDRKTVATFLSTLRYEDFLRKHFGQFWLWQCRSSIDSGLYVSTQLTVAIFACNHVHTVVDGIPVGSDGRIPEAMFYF